MANDDSLGERQAPVLTQGGGAEIPVKTSEGFVRRYLDPASRLGEILFGLIMVLTVTSTAGLTVSEGRAGIRELLFAAIGCNVAWGIIDAVMYVMNCVTLRTARTRLVMAVQGAADTQTALGLIRDEIEPELHDLLRPEDAEGLSQSILRCIRQAPIRRSALTKEDFYGGLACFWLVFVSCLPAALPFLVFSQPRFALRISNLLLLALLFIVGQKWAAYAGTNRLAAGFAMLAIGLCLVGVAILLGG